MLKSQNSKINNLKEQVKKFEIIHDDLGRY